MSIILTGIIIIGMIVIFIGAPVISICLRRMNYDQLK